MTEQTRAYRRQLLLEAEGYLELAVALDDRWPLEDAQRDVLTSRCLEALDKIENPKGRQAQIHYLRGQALRLKNQFEAAIESLELSWHLESHNVHTCLALGWCYKRLGRIDDAIEAMQLGLSVDPHSAILHYNLACYLALCKRARAAIKHLAIALDIQGSLINLISEESDFDPIREMPCFAKFSRMLS
ncbi:MAG TPA: tetratricopeptide repeat protein [Pirellulaceae bacterium]|nr:tetratricopeptide repeat protein [Pirellulaceae bacterium]HMO91275.1 tetratricopeptide repeat protein [Pirellulaceae bacterium]HMP68541.1 tetratricopeptide repeat protein [Pirellulaceae bacterium]